MLMKKIVKVIRIEEDVLNITEHWENLADRPNVDVEYGTEEDVGAITFTFTGLSEDHANQLVMMLRVLYGLDHDRTTYVEQEDRTRTKWQQDYDHITSGEPYDEDYDDLPDDEE